MSLPDDLLAESTPEPVAQAASPRWAHGLVLCLLVLTVLKGLRMPGKWSVTQYLFTYRVGFIKRGLWGEVLHRVFGSATANYFVLAGVGLVVGAAIIALLVWLMRRLPDEAERLPLTIVIAASPAVAFVVHLAGYLEQVGYLAMLGVLALHRRQRAQAALAIGSAALLPLVHEASFLLFGGLLLLATLVGPGTSAPTRTRVGVAALVALVGVGSTLAVLQWGRVSHAQMETLRADQTAFFEIRPRQDAFETLTVPLAASLADMRRRWSDPDTQLEMLFSLMVFGPAGVLLTLLAWRRARALDGPTRWRSAAGLLVVCAVAGPLTLHLVGWDLHRWNSLVVFNAAIAALALFSARVTSSVRAHARSRRMLAAALVVAAWSVSADPVFFDGYGASHPPFSDHIQFLIEAAKTGDRAMWLPRN
jgi:hypothetical protein